MAKERASRCAASVAGVVLISAVGCGSGDPVSSFQTTTEVHRDLTALLTDELGEQPEAVTATLTRGRCTGLFGSADETVLDLHSTWTSNQDLTQLDAAIQAAHLYLRDRDGAEAIRTLPDGRTIVSSADTAGINLPWLPYETSAGGSSNHASIRTFGTVCVDPETIGLANWETRGVGTETSPTLH